MTNEELQALIEQQGSQLEGLERQAVGAYHQVMQLRHAIELTRQSLAALHALVTGEESEHEELQEEVHNE